MPIQTYLGDLMVQRCPALDAEQYDRLKALSETSGKTLSEIVRAGIELVLAKHSARPTLVQPLVVEAEPAGHQPCGTCGCDITEHARRLNGPRGACTHVVGMNAAGCLVECVCKRWRPGGEDELEAAV